MSFRLLASVNAVVSAIVGAIGLVMPALLASQFGVTATERETAVIQLLGASYVGFAAVLWTARGTGDPTSRIAIAAGSLIAWAASFVVSLLWMGLWAGLAGANAVMQAAFALAWAYVLFTSRGSARNAPWTPAA